MLGIAFYGKTCSFLHSIPCKTVWIHIYPVLAINLSIYLSIPLLYFTFSRANSVLSSMDVVGSVHFQLSFTNLHEIYIYYMYIMAMTFNKLLIRAQRKLKTSHRKWTDPHSDSTQKKKKNSL